MKKALIALLACTSLAPSAVQATWTALAHQPPAPMSTTFLLFDGRVLSNEVDTSGLSTVRWWVLTPDPNGSYQNGTWSRVGDAKWTHLYFGSGTFKDGRVIVCGGEYSTGGSETNKTEIFDPLTNTWTEISGPTGWANVGDAPSVITEDGRFFVGDIFSPKTAFYDPVSGVWSPGPNKLNSRTTEETWTLLPDGSCMTWDCFGHPATERWIPTTNTWINCGNTPADLVLPGSFETGAAVLLPNGKTFCIGGRPASALYTMPPVVTQQGTWTNGPVPPNVNGFTVGAEDAPAAMTPDGKVLCCLGRVSANGGEFFAPTWYFEYDGTNFVRITDPGNNGGPPYVSHFLNLPTGEILVTAGSTLAYMYTNGGVPQNSWKPVITAVPAIMEKNMSYTMLGTQLNGVTNGNSYGDECFTATNYPIIRLSSTAGPTKFFARMFSPSTLGVQTGATPVSANYAVGGSVAAGNYQIQAIASGIASDPVNVVVANTWLASNYSVFRGTYVSGGIADFQTSDNNYLVVKRGFVANPSEAPMQIDFTVSSSIFTPTFMGVSLEDSVNTAGLSRSISLLNVNTGQYEQIDFQSAPTSDSTTTVGATGSLSRFVNQSTGLVKCRIAYPVTGFLATFVTQTKIDRFVFLIN